MLHGTLHPPVLSCNFHIDSRLYETLGASAFGFPSNRRPADVIGAATGK
jgi:hypothetical protein